VKVEEENVASLKARLVAATQNRRPKILPHPEVICGYVANLLSALETDKVRARALLARHMPPLVLTADGDTYRVTGGFNLSVLLDDEIAAAAAVSESMISAVGGTGYPDYRNGGMWVPVEATIA